MGCGDGALLKAIYLFIKSNTRRGKLLDEYPLTMCGITFSRENDRVSLIQTGITLTAADVPHKLMFGDIDQPESVQAELEAKFGVTRNDVLHVRSFLDHDRMFAPPIKPIDTSLQQALNDSCDATFVSNAEGFGGMLVTPAEALFARRAF